ncbi:Txe/YoeB family addiction module toxin [Candidatus Tisiphia endosymbiont of Nemotelus uliginosus]|uniref:Txe/YoeB family addiction module toxin n=1 Tax=Candidatus Tisiphia endosymbiont of Nemotelus uliginosus TaxID=3077926 RepID=UPI0035C8ECB9
MYSLYYTSDACKDFKKIKKSPLQTQMLKLLEIIKNDPFQNPPPFKRLRGVYLGAYSRRINLQHRLFYEVDEVGKRIKVLRMWSHYGDN